MKRFWHIFLAVVAMATLANTANAQWSSGGEIGSYQSILSRAGYGDAASAASSAVSAGQAVASQMPIQSAPTPATVTPNVESYNGYGGSYAAPMYGNTSMYQGGIASGQIGGTTGAMPGQVLQGGVSGGFAGTTGSGVMIDQGYVDNGMAVPTPTIPAAPLPAVPAAPTPAPVYSQPVATYSAPVYTTPVYTPPIYHTQPVYVAGEAIAPTRGRASNLVVGLFGVNLRRDYEDDIRLGYQAGRDFFSTDADHGNMNGIGATIASRGANGRGSEIRYWGLDEDTSVNFAGPTYTYVRGYQDLHHGPSGATVQQIYNAGDTARLNRSTEINSVEFNLLRNGGQYHGFGGRTGNYELVGGFRLFQFDESLGYQSSSTFAGYPSMLDHRLEAENLLTGFQIGARNEVCFGRRLRLSKGFTVGIFNNRII